MAADTRVQLFDDSIQRWKLPAQGTNSDLALARVPGAPCRQRSQRARAKKRSMRLDRGRRYRKVVNNFLETISDMDLCKSVMAVSCLAM